MYMYVTYQVIIACGTRLDIERNITYVAMSMYMLMYLYCMALCEGHDPREYVIRVHVCSLIHVLHVLSIILYVYMQIYTRYAVTLMNTVVPTRK